MPRNFALFLLFLVGLTTASGQDIDTLVDIQGSKLHFRIVKGSGTPIVFEAGGGDAGSVWKNLAEPLSRITGAPLVMYDRSGYGKSDRDTGLFWIDRGVDALRVGLDKLGMQGPVVLVAHSMGGFYATLFAAKFPKRVKSAVFFDINHISFFTDAHVQTMMSKDTSWLQRFRDRVFVNTIETLRQNPFPASVPVIDVVAGQTLFEGKPDADRWRQAHSEFVKAASNRETITATGSGHYVFLSNPQLAVQSIVKAYAATLPGDEAAGVWKRSSEYALASAIDVQKKWSSYLHSENDLNEWGYALMGQGKKELAVDVFKLNTTLNPASANTFDSLGEAYEAVGQNALAIEAYRKCLTLDATRKHPAQRLKVLVP